MSWDKNTVNCSEIDSIVRVLQDLKIDHTLFLLGAFEGRGLNDNEEDNEHILRQLNYQGFTILEYVEKDADCDTDDVILSWKFEHSKLPEDWQIIRWTDKNHVMEDNWEELQNSIYGITVKLK